MALKKREFTPESGNVDTYGSVSLKSTNAEPAAKNQIPVTSTLTCISPATPG